MWHSGSPLGMHAPHSVSSAVRRCFGLAGLPRRPPPVATAAAAATSTGREQASWPPPVDCRAVGRLSVAALRPPPRRRCWRPPPCSGSGKRGNRPNTSPVPGCVLPLGSCTAGGSCAVGTCSPGCAAICIAATLAVHSEPRALIRWRQAVGQ